MKHAFIATLCLVACVQTGVADEPVLLPDFSKVDWHLAEVDGKSPDYSATLNLGEPGRISGQAPCNRYFAEAQRAGSDFRLGPIGATRMACLHMIGEVEFLELLSKMTTAKQREGILELSGGGHSMVFLQPVP